MKIVKDKISKNELDEMSKKMFGNLVKAVVDVEKEIMLVDAPMHSDEEAELIRNGSKQENLWGINLYPEKQGEDFIEFDSMINIKPNQNNRSRSVDDVKIQKIIIQIVNKLVEK
ncbi:MAG: DUF5674 family protein [Patescibacteria group bacterium]|nr:DUF5674 family protein [Patescibacteria group bacterium]